MKTVSGGVCAVRGVRAFGLKEGKNGIAVISGGGQATGVFTKNKIVAAPITVTREHLEQSAQIYAVIANSGSANAYTGAKGITNARRMAWRLAEQLNIENNQVAVASTGVIGRPLNFKWIATKLGDVITNLRHDEEGNLRAAEAIMTTDSSPKYVAVDINGLRIGGIAKGAGMIEPNMGTMLAFIYTDAVLPSEVLRKCLKRAVDKSFNMVTVDGDTSTNDMALLIATGKSQVDISAAKFQKGLNFVCIELAKMMAMDGEGATKLIEVRITGAESQKDAVRAAKAVVRSLLVKTALFGADPNWGRIIAAVGYSGANFNPDLLSLAISDRSEEVANIISKGVEVLSTKGERMVRKTSEIMRGNYVAITINLGAGIKHAVAWGCDLTYDYVRINAEYTT
ncbi:MAG TPA: bifunctional ornithine acetyltransferase/N-acetylglutamate synthase [Candidatus Acidoferrales bacterium]|nr:bifunctional ornithine acetyltransferase/N-acetylglutamate synthase [Candidatus Acidoferrales bacterium]